MSRSTAAEPREPREVHRGDTRARPEPCCRTCGELLVREGRTWVLCDRVKCMEKQNRLPVGFAYPDEEPVPSVG